MKKKRCERLGIPLCRGLVTDYSKRSTYIRVISVPLELNRFNHFRIVPATIFFNCFLSQTLIQITLITGKRILSIVVSLKRVILSIRRSITFETVSFSRHAMTSLFSMTSQPSSVACGNQLFTQHFASSSFHFLSADMLGYSNMSVKLWILTSRLIENWLFHYND